MNEQNQKSTSETQSATNASYIAVATGNKLVVKPNMFFYRGKYFSGLVDEQANALYDNPADSFAKYTGIESSLEKGLIKAI